MKQQTSIKYWAEDDRPREKLMLKGKHNLSDAELLAIILQTGYKDKTAVELAREMLMQTNNSIAELSRKSIHELKQFKGIGEAKAISLVAAFELGLRKSFKEQEKVTKITSSLVAVQHLRPYFAGLKHEEFYTIYLNNNNLILHTERISIGGITATVADIRIILKKALEVSATSIILAHNHPSRNKNPSPSDVKLTKKVKEAVELMEMSVLDHLIITEDDYYSFSDDSKLSNLT